MTVRAPNNRQRFLSIRLHYRHVNQALEYVVADMQKRGDSYLTTIPGEYTHTRYPLQYFFELRNGDSRAWLYPGFDADLSNQPYYVVRSA